VHDEKTVPVIKHVWSSVRVAIGDFRYSVSCRARVHGEASVTVMFPDLESSEYVAVQMVLEPLIMMDCRTAPGCHGFLSVIVAMAVAVAVFISMMEK
jgi:hypothetical protein